MSSQSTEQTRDSNLASAGVVSVVEPESQAARSGQGTKAARRKTETAEGLAENRETLINLYHQMLLIRRFEEKCAESYSLGKIGGFCHLYIGQEAVGVGAISALRPDDYVLTSYREHGQAIAKGIPAQAVMAELYGKAGGCSHGKGGSMHLFSSEVNFLGGHAIVGGQIPLATGVAFAAKYRETDQVALCFFGEAAVNQGAFHESMNLAQLWKLPCIYICENNKYGMGTSLARAMSLQDIAEKACAYEMHSELVDGMDVLAMRQATQRAVERARRESLPTLIEARTYRFMGHSMSDPGKYRTREEIEKNQERDPISLFRAKLMDESFVDDRKLEEIEQEIKEEIEKALHFAEESPPPDERELYTDVYANP
jgi:pyruvate dehydrogenase E1 component alpha subunit